MRIMHDNIAALLHRLRALQGPGDDCTILTRAFGPLAFVHLSRTDKVAQAVSLTIAEQTGLWHKNADGTDRENFRLSSKPIYDHDQIALELAGLEAESLGWNTWFAANKISPLSVTYEGLAADPKTTLARVLTHINQDPDLANTITPGTQRLANALNVAWASRFRAETGLPFAPREA